MADSGDRLLGLAVSAAKAEAAFLAFAAGDALGWPQEIRRNTPTGSDEVAAHVEFRSWSRRSGGRFRPYEEIIQPGEYSDDTQLTLAVARSRTNHGAGWWKALTRIELPLWMLYERGGGAATKRSAASWARGCPPWKSKRNEDIHRYFAAGGNGVAMRVLPHALFLAGEEDTSTLVHDVVLDGSATHGHPRALVGASVYAYAAWWLARRDGTLPFGELLDALIDGTSEWSLFPKSDQESKAWFEAANSATDTPYDVIWIRTVHEMKRLLEAARKGVQAGALADDHAVLNDLGCFGKTKGAGTSSAAAAVYLVTRHAAQPVQGILSAAFEKGADTDTLAAMAGGLMGCLAGVEWLPRPWLQVQDAAYLRNLATQVTSGPTDARQLPVEPVPAQSIPPELLEGNERAVILGGTLQARATELPGPKPIAKSIAVRSWRLSTSFGQTMYVTDVRRLSPEEITDRATNRPTKRRMAAVGVAERNAHYGEEQTDLLYTEFCRQLNVIGRGCELKRRNVEKRLGLVPSQVRTWLNRAEEDGKIRWTSKKPATFMVSEIPNDLEYAGKSEAKPDGTGGSPD